MKIAIRLEPNGKIYIDKHLRENIPYTEPPYNFTLIDIDDQYADCESADFDDDLTFSVEKYTKRKQYMQIEPRITELKQLLQKYKEDVEQVELFGMERADYEQKKQLCAEIILELRQLEKELRDGK